MSSAESAVSKRRRNGTQQACEPCRKSKLRCDHNMPICGRCRRRRDVSKCKYEASPSKNSAPNIKLAPPASPAEPNPRKKSPVLQSEHQNDYEIFAAGSSYVQRCPNGFLGPTAYSAIFLEQQGKLDLGHLDPCKSYKKHEHNAGLCDVSHDISVSHDIAAQAPNDAAIRLGIHILNAFPSQDICERLIERYDVFDDIVSHKPSIKVNHKSFWDTYGRHLVEPRDPAKLSIVSKEMCRNAWSMLGAELPKDRHEWTTWVTGHGFRWEIVGVFIAMFGMAAVSLPDWDPLFISQSERRNDRRKFACSMIDLVEACLLLSDHADNVSALAVHLLQLSTELQAYCETGKTSYLLWKRHGSLVSSVTALGLHRDHDVANPRAFIVSELRKRQFIAIFCHDKTIAAFTGRPPLLSRRYSTCQLPLDLSDEQLMADEPELSQIKKRLDTNGWNTSGNVYAATWARALLLINLIRDEILEISLCISNERSELVQEYIYPVPKQTHVLERYADIMLRCDAVYTRLPQSIRFNTNGPSATTASIFSRQINLRLTYLQCLFMLERVYVSHGHASAQRLIDLATQMVDDVLILWAKRDWLVDFQYQFAPLFTMYGVPSAGVLCVELLKATNSPGTSQTKMPRAEIIRKLSIFISCLEWGRPTDESYNLCGHMHKIISHIMDQVLAPPTSKTGVNLQMKETADTDSPSDFALENDTDWLQWLNTVDWSNSNWADLG